MWMVAVFQTEKNNRSKFIVEACSDVLVTPGASKDGSAMIAYNADDAALYGVLYHYPATTNNPANEMLKIYNWDTGVSLFVTEIQDRELF